MLRERGAVQDALEWLLGNGFAARCEAMAIARVKTR